MPPGSPVLPWRSDDVGKSNHKAGCITAAVLVRGMNWSSLIAAGTFLAAFVLFFPALVNQFRSGDWLPGWVPDPLRRRPNNPLLRAIAVAWTAMWSIGGQAIVAYLAAIEIGRANVIDSAALGLELILAGAFAVALLRHPRHGTS